MGEVQIIRPVCVAVAIDAMAYRQVMSGTWILQRGVIKGRGGGWGWGLYAGCYLYGNMGGIIPVLARMYMYICRGP